VIRTRLRLCTASCQPTQDFEGWFPNSRAGHLTFWAIFDRAHAKLTFWPISNHAWVYRRFHLPEYYNSLVFHYLRAGACLAS